MIAKYIFLPFTFRSTGCYFKFSCDRKLHGDPGSSYSFRGQFCSHLSNRLQRKSMRGVHPKSSWSHWRFDSGKKSSSVWWPVFHGDSKFSDLIVQYLFLLLMVMCYSESLLCCWWSPHIILLVHYSIRMANRGITIGCMLSVRRIVPLCRYTQPNAKYTTFRPY